MVNGTTTRSTKRKMVITVIWNTGIGPRQDIQKQLVSEISITVSEFVGQLHP